MTTCTAGHTVQLYLRVGRSLSLAEATACNTHIVTATSSHRTFNFRFWGVIRVIRGRKKVRQYHLSWTQALKHMLRGEEKHCERWGPAQRHELVNSSCRALLPDELIRCNLGNGPRNTMQLNRSVQRQVPVSSSEPAHAQLTCTSRDQAAHRLTPSSPSVPIASSQT